MFIVNCAYNGSCFHGWEKQVSKTTVRGTIENCLYNAFGQHCRVIGASRTDIGVHARDQYFVISNLEVPIEVTSTRLMRIFEKGLPAGIEILRIAWVPNFNIRNVEDKTYHYYFKLKNNFRVDDVGLLHSFNGHFDLEISNLACQYFLGQHNFASFTTAERPNYVRKIKSFGIVVVGELIFFKITGSGFLTHQIRMMIGFILAINQGKSTLDQLLLFLKKPKKGQAGYKVPGSGLYLENIKFVDPPVFKFTRKNN